MNKRNCVRNMMHVTSEYFVNEITSHYSHGHQATDVVSQLMHILVSKIDVLRCCCQPAYQVSIPAFLS